MQDESGAIVMAMAAAYDTREQLMESFKEFQEDPLWKDAEFQEREHRVFVDHQIHCVFAL